MQNTKQVVRISLKNLPVCTQVSRNGAKLRIIRMFTMVHLLVYTTNVTRKMNHSNENRDVGYHWCIFGQYV